MHAPTEQAAAARRAAQRPDRLGSTEAFAVAVIVATLVATADLLAVLLGLTGILVAHLFLILLPTVLYVVARDREPHLTLRLRWPTTTALAGGAVIGAAMTVVASRLVAWQAAYLPPGARQVAGWEALSAAASAAPLLASLALVVGPAVAEEALFRGLLLDRLERRYGERRAIWLSAALFTLFHRSLSRVLVQGLLGLLLGMVAVRTRSLAVPIMLHLCYNLGIWVAGERLAVAALEPWVVGCGLLLTAVGVAAVLRSRDAESLHND